MAWTLPPPHVTGDVLAAGDWNDVVSDLSILETAVGLFNTGGYLDGTAPPATTSPAFIIQGGTAVILSNSAGGIGYTFPSPFPNGLLTCVATVGDVTPSNNMSIALNASQTNVNGFGGVVSYGFPVVVTIPGPSSTTINSFQGVVSTNVRVNWLAIGY